MVVALARQKTEMLIVLVVVTQQRTEADVTRFGITDRMDFLNSRQKQENYWLVSSCKCP